MSKNTNSILSGSSSIIQASKIVEPQIELVSDSFSSIKPSTQMSDLLSSYSEMVSSIKLSTQIPDLLSSYSEMISSIKLSTQIPDLLSSCSEMISSIKLSTQMSDLLSSYSNEMISSIKLSTQMSDLLSSYSNEMISSIKLSTQMSDLLSSYSNEMISSIKLSTQMSDLLSSCSEMISSTEFVASSSMLESARNALDAINLMHFNFPNIEEDVQYDKFDNSDWSNTSEILDEASDEVFPEEVNAFCEECISSYLGKNKSEKESLISDYRKAKPMDRLILFLTILGILFGIPSFLVSLCDLFTMQEQSEVTQITNNYFISISEQTSTDEPQNDDNAPQPLSEKATEDAPQNNNSDPQPQINTNK